MREAMRIAGYDELRARAGREARARRATWASACRSSPRRSAPGRARTWTSPASAWPTAPSCACTRPARRCCGSRSRRRARATRRRSRRSSPRSSGIPPEDVEVVHGDTDQTPFGLGTYGSRSTPVSGAATAMVVAQDPRQGAADRRRGARGLARTTSSGRRAAGSSRATRRRARRSRSSRSPRTARSSCPRASRATSTPSRSTTRPTSPIPTAPTSACVDVDPGTGEVKLRRFISVDDCGVRINPMIVEGQIHGGLAEGVGIALMQHIAFDEQGNCLSGSFMDYLVPSSMEVPGLGARRDGHAVAAPPDRRQGRRRVVERRLAAGGRQRGRRRARAVRRAPRRHAGDAGAGVGGDAEGTTEPPQ